MVVGFVNAGLMNLTQAISVIMGANIGTTITGWLVSAGEWAKMFSPSTLAPIAVMVGVIITLVGKRQQSKDVAGIIIGFGILFIGMNTMSDAVYPLRESEVFKTAFISMGSNPFLGILVGAGVTAIIQSSSASQGILLSLASAGLVPTNAAVFIIMGQNIGTCVTAILSSVGASKNAKCVGTMHLTFNIAGTIIFSILSVCETGPFLWRGHYQYDADFLYPYGFQRGYNDYPDALQRLYHQICHEGKRPQGGGNKERRGRAGASGQAYDVHSFCCGRGRKAGNHPHGAHCEREPFLGTLYAF